MACAPRGPESVPAEVRSVLDEVEQALGRRDFAAARRHVAFRYRLEEMLGDLWRGGPESARVDLVSRLEEMFDETSEANRARIAGRSLERRVLRRQGGHLWVESRAVSSGSQDVSFAWHYRLTPMTPGRTTWAITQREYLVDGVPSDSTRFWPMAIRRISEQFGRRPTLPELAANLASLAGTMRIRRLKVPDLVPSTPPRAPTTP